MQITKTAARSLSVRQRKPIQDGIVRLEFAAGNAATKFEKKEDLILKETSELLGVETELIPSRVEELFTKWKNAKKALKKSKPLKEDDLKLVSSKRFSEQVVLTPDEADRIDEHILKKAAETLSTQPEYIPKTVARFLKELEDMRDKAKHL